MGNMGVQGKSKLWPVIVKFALCLFLVSCAAFAFQSGLVYLELALGWANPSNAGQVLAGMIVCIMCYWYFMARVGAPLLTRMMDDKSEMAKAVKNAFMFGLFMFAAAVLQLMDSGLARLGGIDGEGLVTRLPLLAIGAIYGFLGFITL